MGRRSINTTKSGKYMNPTDQARKEARKKELKKNKRQRQMVRAAVLKMKDPQQILEELQKIDEMEYNVLQPPPLNEKVLKEKRKKLRETFDRVLKMYDKDDPEKWVDLKRQEMDYEKRRAHLISYYESVKHAQLVQVDDIPLPTLQVPDNLIYGNVPSQIPLPMDVDHPKPILKKDSVYKERPLDIQPPGVPPGPPPDLDLIIKEVIKDGMKKKSLRFSDMPDEGPPGENVTPAEPVQIQEPTQPTVPPPVEDYDGEELEESDRPASPSVNQNAGANAAPKPTSLQQRMLALSGQNIDEFMKEMEEVHKKRERDRAADLNARLCALKNSSRDCDSDSDGETVPATPAPALDCILEPPGTEMRPMPPLLLPPGLRPTLVPPPLRPALRPPAPPLRMAPPGPPPGPPPLRAPPPPAGPPPRLTRPPPPPPPRPHHTSVLSAAPQLITKRDGQGATIIAKPQIRNLSADVTRFVPSALRVRREPKKSQSGQKQGVMHRMSDVPKQAPSKDDAYMQFMREMEDLL